jgi:hypothetical protein
MYDIRYKPKWRRKLSGNVVKKTDKNMTTFISINTTFKINIAYKKSSILNLSTKNNYGFPLFGTHLWKNYNSNLQDGISN